MYLSLGPQTQNPDARNVVYSAKTDISRIYLSRILLLHFIQSRVSFFLRLSVLPPILQLLPFEHGLPLFLLGDLDLSGLLLLVLVENVQNLHQFGHLQVEVRMKINSMARATSNCETRDRIDRRLDYSGTDAYLSVFGLSNNGGFHHAFALCRVLASHHFWTRLERQFFLQLLWYHERFKSSRLPRDRLRNETHVVKPHTSRSYHNVNRGLDRVFLIPAFRASKHRLLLRRLQHCY